jgi:hypothetical protein
MALNSKARKIIDMYRQQYLKSLIWEITEELERCIEVENKRDGGRRKAATKARDKIFLGLYRKRRTEQTAKWEAKQFAYLLNKLKR